RSIEGDGECGDAVGDDVERGHPDDGRGASAGILRPAHRAPKSESWSGRRVPSSALRRQQDPSTLPGNTSGHVRNAYWPDSSRAPYRGRRGCVNPDYPVTSVQRMRYVTAEPPAFAEVQRPAYATKTCPTTTCPM